MSNRLSMGSVFYNLHEGRLTINSTDNSNESNGLLPINNKNQSLQS
jgi:hypothetical protein